MAKKEKEIKEKKQKKNNSYFKEMKTELKKVVWPTPKELLDNTIAVIAFVLIVALIVFVLDFCFDNLNKYGITKLQETVQSSFKTEEDTNTVSDENSSEDEETVNIEEAESAESEEQIQEQTEESSEETVTENQTETTTESE